MSNTPFFQALLNLKSCSRSSFHMPGHKNAGFQSLHYNIKDLWQLDYTDNLPGLMSGFAQAENLAKEYFGTQATLFSAGGNTLCIQAMLKLAMPAGGKLICGRNIHCSAVNAMILLNLLPIWVEQKIDAEQGLVARAEAADIEKTLHKHKDAKAVYITSPDYYGIVSDISAIADVCHKYDVPLLVDNAHGAHFFCMAPALHPLHQNADLCADSTHKTLPVLTGGAWLHIQNSRYIQNAKDAMALFASTSPSLPILASLDICRDWMENEGVALFSVFKEKVRHIKTLAQNYGFVLPKGPCDPGRIVLSANNLGFSGHELASFFRKCAVEPEFATQTHIILIPSPMNTDSDFRHLATAVSSLKKASPIAIPVCQVPPAEQATSPQKAAFSKNKWFKTDDLAGQIAAEMICPYPPGTAVLIPGERINKDCVAFLKSLGIPGMKVLT